MGSRRETSVLTALTTAACLVAIGAVQIGRSYPLEAFGFVTGVVCVYLAARDNVWNWPIGLLNSSASMFVMFRDRLFADAALYVVYFISGVLGWYWWLNGGAWDSKAYVESDQSILDPEFQANLSEEVKVSSTPKKEWPLIGGAAAAAFILVAYWMFSIEGAAPLVDTFVTVMSLVAQYLLTRKYIENWIIWILVDVIYVPLFLWKGLYLYAILFGIFTVIAYFGLRQWKNIRDEQTKRKWPMPARAFVHALLALGVIGAGLMTWSCLSFENGMPTKALTTLKSFDPVTAKMSYNGWEQGKELTESQYIHVKANLLDPMLFKKFEGTSTSRSPIAFLRFYQKDKDLGREVEQFTYEIFSDHARVDGKPVTLDAFEKMKPYLPKP